MRNTDLMMKIGDGCEGRVREMRGKIRDRERKEFGIKERRNLDEERKREEKSEIELKKRK